MSDDRVLWITGASAGIGAATARLAAASGWRLVLAARSLDKLTALADELGGSDRALAVECDVTSWDDQQAALVVALEHFGRLDRPGPMPASVRREASSAIRPSTGATWC